MVAETIECERCGNGYDGVKKGEDEGANVCPSCRAEWAAKRKQIDARRETTEYPSVRIDFGGGWSGVIDGVRDHVNEETGKKVSEGFNWYAVKGGWEDDYHSFSRFDTCGDAKSDMRKWFAVHDMGSLDPLDLGFDAKTVSPITIPEVGFVRVKLPRSKKHPEGKVLEGRRWSVIRDLKSAGFSIA